MQLEENLNKDELFTLKQATNEMIFLKTGRDNGSLRRREIEEYTDEHEKELAIVSNYLIKNEIKSGQHQILRFTGKYLTI